MVKILADRMPGSPTGTPFELVEFEGLQVTPYVDTGRCQDQGPLRTPGSLTWILAPAREADEK